MSFGYHGLTAYDRSGLGGWGLDWSDEPRLFKEWGGRRFTGFGGGIGTFGLGFGEALSRLGEGGGELDLAGLGSVLGLSNGVTHVDERGRPYRPAASAGALHPTEWFVKPAVSLGLTPGFWAYSPDRHGLVLLRETSPEEADAAVGFSGTVLIGTGVFYRSAWKYRKRAFRYVLLDAGHVAENAALVAAGLGVRCDLRFVFDDVVVSGALGLDRAREVPLLLTRLGPGREVSNGSFGEFSPDAALAAASRSARMDRTPQPILDAYAAGCESSAGVDASPVKSGLCSWPGGVGEDLLETIIRRRSRRNYRRTTMPRAVFEALAGSLAADLSDFCDVHLAVAGVEGAADGLWSIRSVGPVLEREGTLLTALAEASLDQMWLETGSVIAVFSADGAALEAAYGPRTYRRGVVQAGRLGERLYLAAQALGLGCCGIGAFYDEEVRSICGFGDDRAVLYLVGLGMLRR